MAQALAEAWARSSVARVLRAFSPYRRAVQRGAGHARGAVLAAPAKLLGIVKRRRQQHRERQELAAIIWREPSGETGGLDQPPPDLTW